MFWKRPWAAVTLVVLAQLAILLCYRFYLAETSTSAAESRPRVVLTDARALPAAPAATHQSSAGEPRVLSALLQPPPVSVTPAPAESAESEPMAEPAKKATSQPVPPVPPPAPTSSVALRPDAPSPVATSQVAVPVPPAPPIPAAPAAAPAETTRATPPAPPSPVVTTTPLETTTTPPISTPAPPPPESPGWRSEPPRFVAQPQQIPPPGVGFPPAGVSEESLKALAVPLVGTGEPKNAKPPTPATEPVGPCPWTLRIELIKGRSHLTAQIKDEVQFRIRCDKLDLQAPRGNIRASGTVEILSEGLEATCDHLTIAWSEDAVLLDGQAHLKCRREGQNMEMKAPKLSLRLSVAQGGISGAVNRDRTESQELNRPVRSSTSDTAEPPFGGYPGSSEPSCQPPTPPAPRADRPKSQPTRRPSDW